MNNYSFLEYESIGFDVDGTLYDEYSFVSQSYLPIASFLSGIFKINKDSLYKELLLTWKQNGSSFPVIQETLKSIYKINLDSETLKKCIDIYRQSIFTIHPFSKIESLLNYLTKNKKRLFVVTDGNKELQLKKIHSLELERWFKNNDIFISGNFGKEYQKPSELIVQVVKNHLNNNKKVLFVGDRTVDQQFAINAGFDFLDIKVFLKDD